MEAIVESHPTSIIGVVYHFILPDRPRKGKAEMKISEPRRLPSGAWNVRVMVDGKRTSITRPTKKECLAVAAALKTGARAPATPAENKSLGQLYDEYIDQHRAVWSPSTLAGYLRLRRNTFQPLMLCKAGRITAPMIQREINAMTTAGKSPKYIANAHGLLHAVLAPVAPNLSFADIVLPRKQKPDLRMLTDEEISRILMEAEGTEMELPILLALWMGMRMSEIRGVKRSDIREGKLHVCRAIVDDSDGRPAVKGTKTYAGDRWLALPDYVAGLVPDGPKDDFIVHLSGQAIYKRFSRLLDKAGISHCRFHDLRKANAAAMIRLGIDSKYAQQRNGWASDYMYKQVYGYTMPDQMAAVNDVINDYFGNKIGNKK